MNSKTCEKLKEMLEKKSPKYTVSFDGNIIAMSEDFITGDEIKEIGIERFDAFKDFNAVVIPEDQARILLDAFDAIIYNNLEGFSSEQLEAIETLRNSVHHIQYQAMLNWIYDYIRDS